MALREEMRTAVDIVALWLGSRKGTRLRVEERTDESESEDEGSPTPSTQYPVPSTQYPVQNTPCRLLCTKYWVLGTAYWPLPSLANPASNPSSLADPCQKDCLRFVRATVMLKNEIIESRRLPLFR